MHDQPPNDLCCEIKNLMRPYRLLFRQAQRFKRRSESQRPVISKSTTLCQPAQDTVARGIFNLRANWLAASGFTGGFVIQIHRQNFPHISVGSTRLRSGDAKLEGGVDEFTQVCREKLKSRTIVAKNTTNA